MTRNWNIKPIQGLVNNFKEVGSVLKSEIMNDDDGTEWKRGIVTFENKNDAQAAIDRFHESSFEVSVKGGVTVLKRFNSKQFI